MSILNRYILKLLSIWTLIVLGVLVSFRVIGLFVEELEDAGIANYGHYEVILFTLMRVPGLMYEFFPVSLLFGGLLALGGMARNNEITVLRSAGISLANMVNFLLINGLVLIFSALVIGELIAPVLDKQAELLRAKWLHKQTVLQSSNGVWIRDGDQFAHIKRISPKGDLSDVKILSFSDKGELALMQNAKKAQFLKNKNSWLLEDVSETRLGEIGYAAKQLDSVILPMQLDHDMLTNLGVEPAFLSITQLSSYISFLHDNEQRSPVYELAFWSKLSVPFLSILMLMLSLPFVMRDTHISDIGKQLLIGAIVGVVFYISGRTVSYVTVIYNLPPALVAWIPVSILALATLIMYKRMNI